MKSESPPGVRLSAYTPPPFLVDHIDLTLRLDGADTWVRAAYAVRANPAAAHDQDRAVLTLDAEALSAVVVRVDGTVVEAQTGVNQLSFALSTRASSLVEVSCTLDPAANTALSGLYLTNGVYCTQCEAEGFRRIVPFPDRPDVLATYTVRLEARREDCPVLLSNGNPVASDDLGAGWHSTTWHDPHPKPCYLFALVGGRLDTVKDSFTTADGRKVALAIHVEPGKGERAAFAMASLKRSMAWDETRFGRIYDLDVFNIVAVSDFNLGAMENKGLNIFNDKYILASPETATDEDYGRIDAIIAHEYFHNWSGNRVTCRDWFQLCLKEGLTVFRDQEYTSDVDDRTIKRIHDVRDLWAHQFPEDAGPLAHAVRPDTYREINNFYTATVYEKGAEIVRMIANWLGPLRFLVAMDHYFSAHDGQAVCLEDFLAAMQTQSTALGAWPDFLGWYTQAGTPKVTVAWETDPARGTASLDFTQATAPTPGQPDKKPLPIPCKLALVQTDGTDVDLSGIRVTATGGRIVGDLFLLEAQAGGLSFEGLPQGTLRPSLFRDYSAPVNHTLAGLDESDRLFLSAHDSNAFSRWAHMQALIGDALQRRYHRIILGEPPGEDGQLFDAMLACALCCGIDEPGLQASRAASITLPSAHDLARTIGSDVNPLAIEQARAQFSADLCSAHGPAMLEALAAAAPLDCGLITPQAAARRALVIAFLNHLTHWSDARAHALIAQAHHEARGMTMRVRTLACLVERASPMADEALAAFKARFRNDPLSMDKWFSVQAGAGTLAKVQDLEADDAYDSGNPNRVRSLLGVFVAGNLVGFHAADGSGYRYLADRIASIDRRNPQLAARLAASFRAWPMMESDRRSQARDALTGLAAQPGLSSDVSDIVGRILER